jgi:hydroxymethylbilane synthase
LHDGLVLAAVPRREDARDVVVTRTPGGLGAVPEGGRIGTSSPRRAALLRAARPDLQVVPLRGNVETRLKKLQGGEVDATVLAAAGLRRLKIEPTYVEYCDPAVFLPAVGQGALALEVRRGEIIDAIAALEDADSRVAIDAERGFLAAVGGSCVTPLAGHATVDEESVTLRVAIAHPSGEPILRRDARGARDEASEVGAALGRRLLADGGAELLREIEELS